MTAPQRSETPRFHHWLITGGVLAVVSAIALFIYITGERRLLYLTREPITAAINRVANSPFPDGYCTLEVWRLSDESRDALRADGPALLVSPHRFGRGWRPAPWRALDATDPGALPWNPLKCKRDARIDFLRWSREARGYAAVMRRVDENGVEERALFLLALDSGRFARAVFSTDALAPLDPAATPVVDPVNQPEAPL